MTIRTIAALGLILLGTLVIAISILVTDTLGVLLILGGLILLCGWNGHGIKLAATLVVLWATNPISSHLIARMELITGRDIEPDQLTGEGEREL